MTLRGASIALLAPIVLMPWVDAQGARDRPLETVAAGLAEDVIAVTVNSSGLRVVLFAAPLEAEDSATGIGVAVIGPSNPYVVTRNMKGRSKRFEFAAAPEVFVSGIEPQVIESLEEDALRQAGLEAAGAAIPRTGEFTSPEVEEWRRAFVRLQEQRGQYVRNGVEIERLEGGLRRASINLPKNAPPGEYRVRTVVFQKGRAASLTDKALTLERAGIDATLHDLATDHSLIYGLLAVLIGSVVGGVAAMIGRR